jgi:hypothetical protein
MMLPQIPFDRTERWKWLQVVAAGWFPPLRPDDGVSAAVLDAAEVRLGVRLPLALREWYLLCGNRPDIWSRQDRFLTPQKLRLRNGMLVFYQENQGVVEWGISLGELGQEDPPVAVDVSDLETRPEEDACGGWVVQNATTSEFALQMLLGCVKFAAGLPFAGNGACPDGAIQLIEQAYPQLPLPDWHWPGFPTRFYGCADLLIEVDGPASHPWLWVAARKEAAFRGLLEVLEPARVGWDDVSSLPP